MAPLDIMPLRHSRATQTLMIYSIPEPKPRMNPPVLQEELQENKKQCHHLCTDQLTQDGHEGNGSRPKPISVPAKSLPYCPTILTAQIS